MQVFPKVGKLTGADVKKKRQVKIMGQDEKLICPYCGKEQLCHEPDDTSAACCSTECEFCDRMFWYSVDVRRVYSSVPDEDGKSFGLQELSNLE